MNNNVTFYYIEKCLLLVESRFNRGVSQKWTNYDLETLSINIQEDTDVLLSITTLKRVFGKVKYNNTPSIATLNALARYAGFADWSDFRSKVTPPDKDTLTATPVRNLSFPRRWYWWAGGIVMILLLSVFWTNGSRLRKEAIQDTSAYIFSSSKVLTAGVPNSVIFKYDATAAGRDSIFITQNWDTRRKKLVSKDNNTYSSIYYYPGFFRARLIVGNKVMRHHDLMITSGGWLALAEQPAAPVYFKKEAYLRDSMVIVTPSLLDAYHLPLQPLAPAIRFFNVGDFPGLQDDNFTFETTLKNELSAGNDACQQVEIMILCKNDVIIIPLCAKGCVGSLHLFAEGLDVTSAESDLSGFGCNPAEWVNLRVESVNRHMRFIVNGKEAYALDFPNPPSGIVGVEYRFKGPAAVKTAIFHDGKKVIKLL